MYPNFVPLPSQLVQDPDAAWTLCHLLNSLADAVWELHEAEFVRRAMADLHAEEWPDVDEPDPNAPPVAGHHQRAPLPAAAGSTDNLSRRGADAPVAGFEPLPAIDDDDIPF